MRILFSAFLIAVSGPLFLNCSSQSNPVAQPDFTRADSLTDHYLSLNDSIHQLWNVMINYDNEKLGAMHHLMHELMVSNPQDRDAFRSMEEKLAQLMRMRYTQKTMVNSDVVTEYDVACEAIVHELLMNAQAKKEYSYNKTLQKLVADIHAANREIDAHRIEYDSLVHAYNCFIDEHKPFLLQTDATLSLDKKPLFETVSNH